MQYSIEILSSHSNLSVGHVVKSRRQGNCLPMASVVMDGLEKIGKPKSSAEQSAEERADQIENLLTVTLEQRIQHLGRLWEKRDPRVWNESQKEFSGSDMDIVFT